MRALRSRRSPIACVLLLLYLPACHSWHTGTPTPAEFVETERPQSIRVTLADSSTLTVNSPVVRGDSLTGFVYSVWRDTATTVEPAMGNVSRVQDTTRTVSLALSDISRVEVKKFSAGRMLGIVAVSVGIIIAIFALTYGEDSAL